MAYTIKVNGVSHSVDVDDDTPLLWVLRDVLGMTGTKFGCGMALCGACTVHIDGAPTRSCITTIDSVGDSAITTIEAIDRTPSGRSIQKAWVDLEVPQCGYCQSGQIMSASALAEGQSAPERFRYRRRHGRQHLPLRHLRPHPRGDQAGGGVSGSSHEERLIPCPSIRSQTRRNPPRALSPAGRCSRWPPPPAAAWYWALSPLAAQGCRGRDRRRLRAQRLHPHRPRRHA